VLLYPQGPNCGRCIAFLVISQEELLFGAALLATLHSDPDVPTMADFMCTAGGADVIDSWFAPRRTLPSRCSSLLLSGVSMQERGGAAADDVCQGCQEAQDLFTCDAQGQADYMHAAGRTAMPMRLTPAAVRGRLPTPDLRSLVP
jgi:hypothetical protein